MVRAARMASTCFRGTTSEIAGGAFMASRRPKKDAENEIVGRADN
jgi:hypothetical protein